MSIVPCYRNWLPVLLIAVTAVLFYYPVLFEQQTQIHAEGVSLGISLMHMLSTGLHGETGMLWTTSIYGGHPIFAEGQGGFANPLHLVLAWLLPAIQSYNTHQFLSMFLSGVGAYFMCRSFGCGRVSALFAALSLILSGLWIVGRSNLAVGSTIGWVPWALWGMNAWLQRPDLLRACLFGSAMALMVVSGYPQVIHGVLIYIVVYLAVLISYREPRELLLAQYRKLVVSLIVAVLVCAGLSAVQWLPLLELAQESHRSGGVSIIPQDNIPAKVLLRGFLYTFSDSEQISNLGDNAGALYFAALGSLFVCLVISMFVFFRHFPETKAHLVAALFLTVLGFGTGGSPIFKLLYDLHLIPGLHSFRVSFTYLYIALVGWALIGAITLDCLARCRCKFRAATPQFDSWFRWRAIAYCATWFFVFVSAVFWLHLESVSSLQYGIAAVWVLACFALLTLQRERWLPSVALVLLCLEIIFLRVDAYNFSPVGLISKPGSIEVLEGREHLADFKFADRSYAAAYSFLPSKSPAVEKGLARMLASVTPASNALWGVSSLTGNLALGLGRRALADPLLDLELQAGHSVEPGLRLIDFASLKYVAVEKNFATPGFNDAYVDNDLQVRIVENAYAYPRFQFFHDAIFVKTPEEAADAMAQLQTRALILESSETKPRTNMSSFTRGEQSIRVLVDRSDHYEIVVESSTPVWFFLADSNYPGWSAYLNGNRTPVYSAQLIGKAVSIPAGEHLLKIVFEPISVSVGFCITLVSSCALMAFLCWQLLRRRWGEPVSQV